MDYFKLIAAVREHTVLYDTRCKSYSNPQLKEQIWQNLAATLGEEYSAFEYRRSWNCLRDSFRRYLKKRLEIRNGQVPIGKRKKKAWKYAKSLQFLIPFIRARETCSMKPYLEPVPNPEFTDIPPEVECAVQVRENAEDAEPISIENNDRTETLMDLMIRMHKDWNEDGTFKFFESIALSVKKYNACDQAIVKSQIYNIITEWDKKYASSNIS